MNMRHTSHAILVAAMFFFPIAAANSSDTPMPPPEGELQKVRLAANLAKYGDEFEDPLALVAAARIYGSITGKSMRKDGQPVDVTEILKRAEIFAREEYAYEHVIGLIEDARTATKAWVPATCWVTEWVCGWYGCRWQTNYYPC